MWCRARRHFVQSWSCSHRQELKTTPLTTPVPTNITTTAANEVALLLPGKDLPQAPVPQDVLATVA